MHSTEELIHKLRERAALERHPAHGNVAAAELLTDAANELERLYRALPLDRT